MLLKAFLVVFCVPILASMILNVIYPKPPSDHGKGTMFDLIATRYDFINRALALNLDIGWRKSLISQVTSNGALYEGGGDSVVKILDLATGTADVAILMAKNTIITTAKKKNPLSILGVDPSSQMLAVGRTKVAKEKLVEQIQLDLGDARNLKELPSDEFHAATMSFGIRNVPEKEQCLCEIHRVLQKENNGKGATLEFWKFSEPPPDSGFMGFHARLFIRYVVPVVGAVLSGAPREYMHLQNSIKEFPSPSNFVQLMENLQCSSSDGRVGAFRVDNLIQMNFGSVQLYLVTPIWRNKQ